MDGDVKHRIVALGYGDNIIVDVKHAINLLL
jgi:hypothetical protein